MIGVEELIALLILSGGLISVLVAVRIRENQKRKVRENGAS